MQTAGYYRQEAMRARRLVRGVNDPQVVQQLERMAFDFDQLAEDLERGAVEITHPALMPQRPAGKSAPS